MRNTGLAGIMYATKLICEKVQRSLQRRMTTTFMTLDRKWNSRKSVRSGSLTCTTEIDDVKVGHKSRVAGTHWIYCCKIPYLPLQDWGFRQYNVGSRKSWFSIGLLVNLGLL
jgi:hypothetical protein